MRELSLLAEALRLLDESPEFTMEFWARPHKHSAVVLGQLMHEVERTARAQNLTISSLQNRFDQAHSRLMSEFWPHTWAAHEVHFHKSFEEFCNCPFTCLTEIADCVESISRGASQ